MKITKERNNSKTFKFLSLLALAAVFAVGAGNIPSASSQEAPVKVSIAKYISDEQATSESAHGQSFSMSSSWNTDEGPGSGTYALDAGNGYQEATNVMNQGANYKTKEVFNDVVGATCAVGKPFALVGYTSGDTLEEAKEATPSPAPPVFTNLTSDKYVIVWNKDCSLPVSEPESEFVTVQINKYVDGEQATTESTDSSSFAMNSSWDSENHGEGSGTYALNGSNGYQETTSEMSSGADYSTNEEFNEVVGASCAEGKPFALAGYTSGDTLEEAESATPSTTAPAFTNLTNNKHVIVWNQDCDTDVVDEDNGELTVDSIETIKGSATADGTFANGWKYMFNITLPSDEPGLAMKFTDWVNNSNAANTIAVANNMRISSEQADNGNATIMIIAEDVYTTPDLNIVTDLDPSTPGIQVQVLVEVAIPSGTANGTYTTTYGIRSQD